MVDAYARIKAVNWLQVVRFGIFSCESSVILWNRLVLIVLHRMGPWRYIMINLVFGLVLFCMVLAFLQKTVGSGDVLNYVTRVMKLTRGKLLAKTTGANGRPRNSYNLTNLTLRICLAHRRQWNPMKLCLISYGHMASMLLTPVRKLDVPATALHVQDKYLQPA
jgi:hypothetical protein